MGFPEEAENYFRSAISNDPNNVECYYFYANWLVKMERIEEARSLLLRGVELSPAHTKILSLLNTLKGRSDGEFAGSLPSLLETVAKFPTSENYLELSLAYYRNGEYEKCIGACEKSLEMNPEFALAYNNMCSAYNKLGEWEKAIEACKKALEIKPEFELAKGNLDWAEEELKSKANSSEKD